MENNTTASQGRLLSLDALRGFDMMFIMGVAGIIFSICALFPDGADSWLALQMKHVSWNGFHHHDTIFALFLFISGMTFPFSLAKKREAGLSNGKITLGIVRRALVLFFLGLVYQGFFQFHFDTLRLPSVLARIGIAWALAALLYTFTGKKVQWGVAITILIGYFIILKCFIAPDAPEGADSLSLKGNIAYYIDRTLLHGHTLSSVGDPEGLLSTIPAIVTALFGMFTGRYVKESEDSGNRKVLKLFAVAAIMAVVTLIWSNWFPVNKKLWNSTFVLAAGSYSVAMFALFYWLIDVRGWRKGVVFFEAIGKNSITIYLGQEIISFSLISKFFLGGFAGLFSEQVGSLILQIGTFTAAWLFLYFLYRKKCFLKV